ncbi:TPA: hypothetical protein ACH3X2_001909 [Trebouxia sp. C0005]
MPPQLRNDRQAFGSSRLCCCKQTIQPSSAGPDISVLRPELQRQWHHAKNQHLGDRQITGSSGLRVCGVVTNVPVGFRTSGWPPSGKGRIGTISALIAPINVYVNTIHC